MIELHLIGYTADLGHLVLDLVDGDAGRYRLRVDADLFATIDELREQRRDRGLAVGDLVEFADALGLSTDRLQRLQDDDTRAAAAAGRVSAGTAAGGRLLDEEGDVDEPAAPDDVMEPSTDQPDAPTVLPGWAEEDHHDHVAGDPVVFPGEVAVEEPVEEPADAEEPVRQPDLPAEPASDPAVSVRADRPVPAADESEGLAARALDSQGPPVTDGVRRRPAPTWVDDGGAATAGDDVPTARAPRVSPPPDPRPEPGLSPAEIQARLRSGRSVRAVARAAGVDEERIRRWEVPIVAERARVLDRAHRLRLERPRLGRSTQPLGEAVRRNLAQRGVADEDVAWETSRRRDGRWRVCVRYVSRGRKRSATWTYDPGAGELQAASDNARELGFTRPRRRR